MTPTERQGRGSLADNLLAFSFLLAVATTAFLVMSNAMGWTYPAMTAYMPWFICMLVLTMLLVTNVGMIARFRMPSPTRYPNWATALLLTMVLSGTMWATWVNPIETSFRAQASSMLGYVAGSVLVSRTEHTARWLVKALLVAGVVAWFFAVLAFLEGSGHYIHEYSYLLIPPMLLYGLQRRSDLVLIAASAWIASWGILGQKNTTFLIATMCLFTIGVRRIRVLELPVVSRFLVLATMLGLAGLAGWVTLEFIRDTHVGFSSGNTEFREFMYTVSWNKFSASPVYGDLFSGSPVVEFSLYNIYGKISTLPSHSDIMDLLAHGGILAVTLFAVVMLWVLKALSISISRPEPDIDVLAVLACIVLCGVIQIGFNPVLHRASNGYSFWFVCGMTLSLYAVRMGRRSAEHAVP